jgi:hypothetical protein
VAAVREREPVSAPPHAASVPPADVEDTLPAGRPFWLSPLWYWLAVLATLAAVNALVLVYEPYFLRVATYDHQHTSARMVDYQQGARPDVVFMGTSRALSGFNPAVAEAEIERLTGRRVNTRNMALTGGVVEIQYLILKNIIRDDKKPAVIVYGLGELDITPQQRSPLEYLPYTNRLLRPDDYWRFSGETLDSKIDFWVDRAFPLYRDRQLIVNSLNIAFNPADPAHKFYAPGPDHRDPAPDGFIPGSGNTRAPAAQLEQNRAEYTPILSNYQLDYQRLQLFHELITLAERRGIAVVLVNMPVDAPFRRLWESEERMDQYQAAVEVLANDHRVPLLDLYRGTDGFPADGFWDWHHLNETGAEAVTRLVSEQYLAPIFGGAGVTPGALPASPRPGRASARPTPPALTEVIPAVVALFPSAIVAGEGFNVQPDGQSALAVKVEHATPSTVIVFAGTPLDTFYNPGGILTAKVPAQLIAAPGRYPVAVTDGRTTSEPLDFVVNSR